MAVRHAPCTEEVPGARENIWAQSTRGSRALLTCFLQGAWGQPRPGRRVGGVIPPAFNP